MKDNIFKDQEMQREILAMLLFDRQFLRRFGDTLTSDDFDTGNNNDSFTVVLAGISHKVLVKAQGAGRDISWRRANTLV